MDYSALVDEFIQYHPSFKDSNIDDIETAIKRALVFISPVIYGDYYYEALYLQVAIFLYSSDLNIQSKQGIVRSRTVYQEYSVDYTTLDKNGVVINPYQQQLNELNIRIGLGLGMILG